MLECSTIFNFIFALNGSSICSINSRDKTCTMVTWLAGLYVSTYPSLDTAFQQPKFQAVFYEDFHNLRWQIRVAVVGLQVVIASQPTL